jgi:hypothetical protein
MLAAGCGKKGPPLPPLPNFPVAPADVSATRRGDEVTIRFKVPGANASGITPANIERVDVYAWTGEALAPPEVFRHAAVVASVPVRRPPPPAEPAEEGQPPPPPPAPPTGPGLDQGAAGELTEVLGPEAFEPIRIEKEDDETEDREREPAMLTLAPPDLGPPLPPPLTRRYLVVGVTRGGRRGTPAAAQSVPLWPAPPPPASLAAAVREGAVDLTWTAPEGLRAPVQPRALPPPAPASPAGRPGARPAAAPPEAAPAPGAPAPKPAADTAAAPGETPATPPQAPAAKPPQTAAAAAETATPPQTAAPSATAAGTPATPGQAARPAGDAQPAAPGAQSGQAGPEASLLRGRLLIPWPASTSGYRVYEVPPPGKAPVVEAGAAPPLPAALTPAPIVATSFTDPRLELGVERCYTVRSVATVGTLSVESAPAEPVCVKPTDVFPPAAPASLAAVASEGAISLIWDANPEPDLAGYLVFRGIAPGEKLEAITPKPIRETTYRDTAVKPGERYVYVVVAVDSAQPPNVSPQSNRVEEVAR